MFSLCLGYFDLSEVKCRPLQIWINRNSLLVVIYFIFPHLASFHQALRYFSMGSLSDCELTQTPSTQSDLSPCQELFIYLFSFVFA